MQDRPIDRHRERAIARRLRTSREHLSLSQSQVAEGLGITRERLASYEDGRAPIRFDFALRFCRQLVISEQWLAIGEEGLEAKWKQARSAGPSADMPDKMKARWKQLKFRWRKSRMRMSMGLVLESVFHSPPPKALFSYAYDVFFYKVYESLSEEHFDAPNVRYCLPDETFLMRNWFHALMDVWSETLNGTELFRLLNSLSDEAITMIVQISNQGLTPQEEDTLLREAETSKRISPEVLLDWRKRQDFVELHKAEFLRRYGYAQEGEENETGRLTETSEKHRTDSVKSNLTMTTLLEKVKEMTKSRGAKANLAKDLGVSQASLSEWLRGDSTPGGEVTLRLLTWVNSPKRL